MMRLTASATTKILAALLAYTACSKDVPIARSNEKPGITPQTTNSSPTPSNTTPRDDESTAIDETLGETTDNNRTPDRITLPAIPSPPASGNHGKISDQSSDIEKTCASSSEREINVPKITSQLQLSPDQAVFLGPRTPGTSCHRANMMNLACIDKGYKTFTPLDFAGTEGFVQEIRYQQCTCEGGNCLWSHFGQVYLCSESAITGPWEAGPNDATTCQKTYTCKSGQQEDNGEDGFTETCACKIGFAAPAYEFDDAAKQCSPVFHAPPGTVPPSDGTCICNQAGKLEEWCDAGCRATFQATWGAAWRDQWLAECRKAQHC